MKPNPRNILKLSDKRYDAKEPHKNRRLDVVYSLFKRRDPLPAQTEMAFFTDTSICSGCKSCEIACKQWNMLKTTDIQWSGNSYDNTRDLSSENWRHVKFIERFSEVNETDRTAPPRWMGCSMSRSKGNGSSWPTTASIARSHPVMKPALPAPSFAMNSGVSITRPISAWAAVCAWLPAPSASLK